MQKSFITSREEDKPLDFADGLTKFVNNGGYFTRLGLIMTDEPRKLREEIGKVARRSLNLSKLITQFERLKANPVDNAYKMSQVLDKVQELTRNYRVEGVTPMVENWIESSTREVSALKERFRYEFGRRLQALLRDRGFELSNRYPNLRVKFYTLNIDFLKGGAAISFGHEVLKAKVSLSPEDIVETLEKIDNGLNHPFESQKFVDGIYEAYRRVCRIRDLPLGERVPIMEVLHQFVLLSQPVRFMIDPAKEHFKGYGRANFGYDLYRLRKSGAKAKGSQALGLVTATFDATRKRGNFIWVPDNERGDGTTYSLIYFKEA